jgi:hypothetical protein
MFTVSSIGSREPRDVDREWLWIVWSGLLQSKKSDCSRGQRERSEVPIRPDPFPRPISHDATEGLLFPGARPDRPSLRGPWTAPAGPHAGTVAWTYQFTKRW